MRRAQLVVGALDLGGGPADEHGAHAAAVGGHARRAVDVHRHTLALRIGQVQLDRLAAARRAGLGQHRPRPLDAGVVGQQVEQQGAAQLNLAAAHALAQGRIGLLDAALVVAHQQHVGHGRQHAEDEALRLLQLIVLLLQRDLVVHQLRIDLVHLLDHVQPGRLVHTVDAGAWQQGLQAQAAARRGRRVGRRVGGQVAVGHGRGGASQCTVQTMHGSNERTMCCTATGVASPSATGAPTSACSSAPGVPAASRGEKFQLVGATIW